MESLDHGECGRDWWVGVWGSPQAPRWHCAEEPRRKAAGEPREQEAGRPQALLLHRQAARKVAWPAACAGLCLSDRYLVVGSGQEQCVPSITAL
ncbi:hypothetical protein NDU88_010042 [Pleurodeles waltl]|uniref:Uncharacterized protein n=1 Tax=Pleurodeles waltl TaxID=8319 RepID=A0AAV7QW86_PLEWA|nr:hypothetical protein NDU88_010042 [Pleurodeles waltl]